jgi:pimeloyl-ACP methyl ester carboxylesterase
VTADPASSGEVIRIEAAGGVALSADAFGDPASPPLVLLHGAGQTRGAWADSGARLASLGWRVIAPDLRGHGESEWSPDGRYPIDQFADDVRAIGGSLGRDVVLVGASLGGLSSLLAVGEPPHVRARALVLIDIAHRAEVVGVSRIKAFMRARPDGFESLEAAGAAVAEYLPHRSAPERLEGLRRNLRHRGGRWIWHWDPRLLDDLSGVTASAMTEERHLAAARAAGCPILLVRGAISDLLSAEIAQEFCASVPGATWIDVSGAGHMVAGDRNDRFVECLVPFLSRWAV